MSVCAALGAVFCVLIGWYYIDRSKRRAIADVGSLLRSVELLFERSL